MPLALAALLLIGSVGVVCAYRAFLQPKIYRRIAERRAEARHEGGVAGRTPIETGVRRI